MSDRKKKSVGKSATRVQFGALPYRFDKTGKLEILIVTSRQTKRWIIPKGWPMKGLKASAAAAREAYEEAGVRGNVRNKPVGSYVYDKFLDDAGITVPCEIKVFGLRVTRTEKRFPEQGQRDIRWVPQGEAAAIVDDAGLKLIIAAFAPKPAKRTRNT